MENDENAAYAEAQQAAILRGQIGQYASGAVWRGHVNRDWVNGWLARLGVDPVGGPAQYKINVPVVGNYGATITAESRTEALEKFKLGVQAVIAAGQVTDAIGHCQGVYDILFDPDAEPVFFSGPKDPEQSDSAVSGLDALKDGIRRMLKQGITDQGWGHGYAVDALAAMSLEPLPNLEYRTVSVPVSGTAQMTVPAFAGDDVDAVMRAAETAVVRAGKLIIKPDEVGTAYMPRSGGSMSMELVDDDED